MKLKMLYDINELPCVPLLAEAVSPYGYNSWGPIGDENNHTIGNIWFDTQDENRTDFTELQNLLSAEYNLATFEVIE